MRRVQLAQHRGSRHGVRRRDDGAKRDGRCPRHGRDQPVRDHGHRRRGESDGENHQPGDRRPVVLQISRRGIVCGVEQHGRHEEGQRQLGRNVNSREGEMPAAPHRARGTPDTARRRGGPGPPGARRRQTDRAAFRVPSSRSGSGYFSPLPPSAGSILFVHGFNSSSATWRTLSKLLEADSTITSAFDLQDFRTETAIGALPVVHRLPRLTEAGQSLGARLQAELSASDGYARYIDVTLVGHSMGRLIASELPAGIADAQRVNPDSRLHPPGRAVRDAEYQGSTTLGRVRSVLSAFTDNPQERALRLFSDESTQIHRGIHERVINAKRRARDEYPIPFYCFWGRTDAVVLPESARGHFPAGEPLPGDHFAGPRADGQQSSGVCAVHRSAPPSPRPFEHLGSRAFLHDDQRRARSFRLVGHGAPRKQGARGHP